MSEMKQNSAQTIRVDTGMNINDLADIRFNFYQHGRFVFGRSLRECATEGSTVVIELSAADTRKFSPSRAVLEPIVYPKSAPEYTAPAMVFAVEPSEAQQQEG